MVSKGARHADVHGVKSTCTARKCCGDCGIWDDTNGERIWAQEISEARVHPAENRKASVVMSTPLLEPSAAAYCC